MCCLLTLAHCLPYTLLCCSHYQIVHRTCLIHLTNQQTLQMRVIYTIYSDWCEQQSSVILQCSANKPFTVHIMLHTSIPVCVAGLVLVPRCRCVQCGIAMSICLSIRLSNACIVTKHKHPAKKFNQKACNCESIATQRQSDVAPVVLAYYQHFLGFFVRKYCVFAHFGKFRLAITRVLMEL